MENEEREKEGGGVNSVTKFRLEESASYVIKKFCAS